MLKYNEYLSNVQKVLEELGGICQRCILRYGGVKSSREHRNVIIEENITMQVIRIIRYSCKIGERTQILISCKSNFNSLNNNLNILIG